MRVNCCGGGRRTGKSVVRVVPNARKAFARSGWQKMEGEKYWDLWFVHLLPSIFCQTGLLSALSCDRSEEIRAEDMRAKNGGRKMKNQRQIYTSTCSLLCLYFPNPSPISVHQRSSVVLVLRLLSFCPKIFLPIRFLTEALLYAYRPLRWHTKDWAVRRTGVSEREEGVCAVGLAKNGGRKSWDLWLAHLLPTRIYWSP